MSSIAVRFSQFLENPTTIRHHDKVSVCGEEIMTNDDNLESNLLTSSLLKRCLVYMLVQDDLNNRE